MAHRKNQCVLWIGDKHAGKTTTAAQLVKELKEHSFAVGGILAPSIYDDDQLAGFDIIDIQTNRRMPLAVRVKLGSDTGSYRFCQEGLDYGHSALQHQANAFSDLVIVDEFGLWEVQGKGWRPDVDCMLIENGPPVLLVVRRELVDEVRQLYAEYGCFSLEAMALDSIEKVLMWLKDKRHRS